DSKAPMARFDYWDVRITRSELASLLSALCGHGDWLAWLDDDEFAVEQVDGQVLAQGRIIPAPGGMRIDVTFPEGRPSATADQPAPGLIATVLDWLRPARPAPSTDVIEAVRRAFDAAPRLKLAQANMRMALFDARPATEGVREYFGRGTLM